MPSGRGQGILFALPSARDAGAAVNLVFDARIVPPCQQRDAPAVLAEDLDFNRLEFTVVKLLAD